jgi:hypothetical protein
MNNVLDIMILIFIAVMVGIVFFFVVRDHKETKNTKRELIEQILEHNSDISLAIREHVKKHGGKRVSSLEVVRCDNLIYTKDMSSLVTGVVEFDGLDVMAEHFVVNGRTLQVRKYHMDFTHGLITFSLYGLVYYPYFEIRINRLQKMSVKQLKSILNTTINIEQKMIG